MAKPQLPIGKVGNVSYAKAGDRVQARAYVRTGSGEMRRVAGRGDDEAEALAALRRKAVALWHGEFPDPGSADTLDVVAPMWLEHVKVRRKIRQQTLEVYESNVRTLLLRRIPKLRLSELTPAYVHSFLLRLEAEQSASASNKARLALSWICDFAIRQGILVGANPVTPSEPAREERGRRVEYDLGQVRLIFDKLDAWDRRSRNGIGVNRQRLIDLITIILGTGLRIGEALALRYSGVRFTPEGHIYVAVDGTIVRDRVHGLYRQPQLKHEDQVHEKLVVNFLEPTIRRLVANYVADPDCNPSELLFVSARGGPVEKVGVSRKLQEFREAFREPLTEAGIDVDLLTFKSFRKASAKVVADAQGLDAAADWLAHRDSKTTRIYADPPRRQVAAQATALEAAYGSLFNVEDPALD